MRIAVIGTGIAGMTAAYRLCREHEVTVFEANDYIGGHTNTVDVPLAGRRWSVDTGFIVHNRRNYPQFCSLMEELGVATQPSNMSFSVRSDGDDLEYCGDTLGSLFAQRRNLVRPSFHRLLLDILRFNREGTALAAAGDDTRTLGEFLAERRYSAVFVDRYLIPMGAAIWSTDPARMFDFPALYFVRFFDNHALMQLTGRPEWRTIQGGSHRYVERLTAPYHDRIRLRCPVASVERGADGVVVTSPGAGEERYDGVFIACHSDQALAMLRDPSDAEREVLGAIPYQANEAVLHTDARLLPRRRRAWAAWNYRIPHDGGALARLTYNMNILQNLDAPETFCVTLNDSSAIDPSRIIATFTYHHPVYTRAGVAAQRRLHEVSGVNDTYYCGAYWGYGFHEDGVASAMRAVETFERNCRDEQRDLRRVG